MKKVSAIILCCLLVIVLVAVPVLAAQTATFTATASENTVTFGDTFTVAFSVSKIENLETAGYQLVFDTDRFEYVKYAKGTALKNADYLMGGVNVGSKIAGYIMYAEQDGAGETISGELIVVTFKVKDNAPAGASTITCTPNATDVDNGAVTCSAVGATVTIVCNHQWGQWTSNGEAGCKRTCGKCQEPQTQAHSLGSYTVTTAAGCDKAGEKTATCSVCGYEDKQPVAATGNHIYGAWTKVDDTNHKRTCTTCTDGTPAEETKAHTWSTWTETLKPDCKNPGQEKRTCTAECGAFETRSVPSTGAHNYNTWTKVDDEKHTATCSGCGEFPKTENHTWDNGTVTTPAGCDKAGEKTQTCTATGCGATKKTDIAATGNHTWGAWTKADNTNHKRTCTTCQDGTPAEETEAHKAGTELKSDAENHWYECLCGEKMNVTAHAYNKQVGDAEGHTEGCECGALKAGATKAPHDWDEGVVTLKPTSKKEGEKTFTCNVCGYKRVEAVDKVSTPNTGDNTLVIPMVILAVLSACGLAVTVVARKRASR